MTIEGLIETMPNQRLIYSGLCKKCGEEFYTHLNRGGSFCSARCAYGKRAEYKTLPCYVCGKMVERYASTIRSDQKILCSRKCVHKSFEVPAIKITCSVCGTVVERKPFWVRKNSKHRFCSRPCRNKFYVGENHFSWKGGSITSDGYKEISINGKRTLEHRIVMAKKIGRPLYPFETCHHKDGDRANNHPDNLELWGSLPHKRNQKPGQRIIDILDAVATYYPEEIKARLNKPVSEPIEPSPSDISKTQCN